MGVAAVVQARMGSTRLPGKVLLEVEGKPVLEFLLERLRRARAIDAIVVATSDAPADDAIASFCARFGVECHRGSRENVANRFRDVVDAYELSAFARISGDSPLLDPRLVDRCVELLLVGGCDLVTNVFPRTFPRGQSVEAVTGDAFRRAFAAMTTRDDLEHVTPYLYRHADEFRIRSFTSSPDLADVRLAVDTPVDLATFAAIVAAMDRPHWEYTLDEVVALHRTCRAFASA